MTRLTALGCVAIALLAACGGSHRAKPTATPRPTTTSVADTTADLEDAVRAALRDNDRLSGFVLAHNEIPSWATRSTRGPALAALHASAKDRRQHGVRVRTLSDDLEILEIRIDPSYTRATAMVRNRQRVLPYRRGHPDRKSTTLDERARIELRRLGKQMSFVVWTVQSSS